MDGYTLQADSYEQFLKQHPKMDTDVKEDLQRKIKVFRIMADLNEKEKYEFFTSGAYNEVCKGYFRKAMENCKLNTKTINEVLEEFRWLIDTVGAEEASKF